MIIYQGEWQGPVKVVSVHSLMSLQKVGKISIRHSGPRLREGKLQPESSATANFI
jgi:hypothetical protein